MAHGIKPHRIASTYLAPHEFARKNHRETHHSLDVSLDQYMVEKPNCPGWDVMGDKMQTQREANFGCVTESNFSQMIAEPRDLYKAQELAKADSAYNANVVDPYRKSAGSKKVDSDSAKSASSLSSASAFIE